MTTQSQMKQLLAQRRPGHSLPQAFYTDESLFKLDMEQLFYRQWLFIGHDIDTPNAGDWVRHTVGDASAIVLRHADGELRAFHNSCRHRGSAICTGDSGNDNKLVCPYHQWTYNLDGDLSFAKEMGPGFEPAAHSLRKVHIQSIAGLVFICLAESPPDIAPLIESLSAYLQPHSLTEAKVAHRSSIVENGNWKLVVENNRECYHCGGNHPELCRTYSDDPAMTGVAGDGQSASGNIQEHWDKCDTLGLESRFLMADSGQYRLQRIPLNDSAASFTLSGDVACKAPLVAVDDQALGSLLFFHYPNSWNHFLSDHAVTFVVTPLGPQKTRVTTTWLVHKDAVEGIDYQLDKLIEVWEATNDQDRRLVENNQAGINSPAYLPGPYSTVHEDGVAQFIDWYCAISATALLSEDTPRTRPLPHPMLPPTTAVGTIPSSISTARIASVAPPPADNRNDLDRASIDPHSRAMAEQVSRIAAVEREMPYVYLEQSTPWIDRDQRLEVVSVVPECPDTASFTFRPENGGYFSFAPGQFITLELPVNGEILYRTYTISSSPSRPMSLTVTVKAQPNSIGTRWMLDQLHAGMLLRAHGPAGQFHLYNHPARKHCFISAGSGITPMTSMTNFLYDRGSDLDISFIHSANRPSEIIQRNSVENWAARVPGLSLTWIVGERDPFAAWGGYTGRFNQLILELSTPDFYEREVFCCGPEAFMQAVRDILVAANFDMSHYHEESFAAPVLGEADASHDDTVLVDDAPAQVQFALSGKSVQSSQGTTLLQAAKDAGLNIPSACNFGVCGTCKVKVLEGETHMVHNGGIRDKEIEDGYVLACCTKPISDIRVAL